MPVPRILILLSYQQGALRVLFFWFCKRETEPRTPSGYRRSWVSKRKHHRAVFSRRETPQSKESAEPSARRRPRMTMRLGRAMKNPTSATKNLLGRSSRRFYFYFSLNRSEKVSKVISTGKARRCNVVFSKERSIFKLRKFGNETDFKLRTSRYAKKTLHTAGVSSFFTASVFRISDILRRKERSRRVREHSAGSFRRSRTYTCRDCR